MKVTLSARKFLIPAIGANFGITALAAKPSPHSEQ
jgi:hypothetical protein